MNTGTLSAVPGASDRINLGTTPTVRPAAENSGARLELNGGTTSGSQPRRQILKRAALALVLVAAGVGATTLAYRWWTVGRFIESTDDAYVNGDVTVIAPEVPGFISQVVVADNQTVHAGDLLIKLDDRDYRAALAKADAAVAIQKATLINLDAAHHLQEAVITQAQAEIKATDAEITRTHDDQHRYQNLLSTGAVSTQSSQLADTDYKRALAAGDKANAALIAAERQLDVIDTQKQQTEASLQQANAERAVAQLNLGYTELHAPIDGIVGNRSAQNGAYATTGSQLISLVPTHGLWIDANFKESQLGRMHTGSPATVEVDSLGGHTFHGHVVSIAPATGAQFSVLPPENATGNFTKIVQRVTVRIVVDDTSAELEQLRPGLSVTVAVDGRSPGKASL